MFFIFRCVFHTVAVNRFDVQEKSKIAIRPPCDERDSRENAKFFVIRRNTELEPVDDHLQDTTKAGVMGRVVRAQLRA